MKARAVIVSRGAGLLCLLVLSLGPGFATAATYSSAATTFSWIDASAHTKLGPSTGGVYSSSYRFTNPGTCGTTPPSIDDTISDNIPIGFGFTFGGSNFTQVRVMTNGRLQFNNNVYCGYGSPVTQLPYPDPNLPNTMRIYGADLDPSLQAEVGSGYVTPCRNRNRCYVSYATLGTTPNRRFVVTWSNVPEWSTASQALGNYNVQIILQENGDFIYQFGPHTPAAGSTPAQIGWEVTQSDYAVTAVGYPADNSAIRYFVPGATPGGLNAFESATASGSITGVIRTKVSGTPFAIDVVALNAAKTAVFTSFTGSVKVELLDASNNTGAFDANGCRSTWTPIAGITPTTLTFAASDAGRKTVTLSAAEAWRDVRLRLSSPATGTATTIACTTDNFAIRPASFAALAATDADWQSAGSARSLANAAATGGNVHKAGQPFTVGARAVNAVGATTVNYNGTPVATASACAGTACSASLGTLSLSTAATAGTISSAATYSEAGSLALQLQDASFANVDAGDGSTAAEMTIASSTVTVGRFVPDHFDLALLATPVLRTFGTGACASRSFTYLGQPFGWATAPQATVRARNAAGATTANYAGALWKLAAASLGQSYAATPASPAVDATGLATPSVSSNSDGTGVAAASASDSLALVRPAAPLAPFDADIALSWNVQDASEAAVAGNGTIATGTPLVFATIAFDAGRQMRFGVLRVGNAYGSELLDLPLPIEALHWDGARLATNTADHCTSVAAATAALGNWQRNLAACETAIPSPPARLASGRSFVKLARPGAGNNGSVDVALQLGSAASGQTCASVGGPPTAATAASLRWLQGRWNGAAAYDQNPTARASFGLYRSPLILMRENF